MNIMKLDQRGFHLGILIAILAVCGVVVVLLYVFFTKVQDTSSTEVRWRYDDQKEMWVVGQGVAPTCKDPFVFDYTPVNMDDVTSVGFPGTYRGKSYKVHGTFALSKSAEVRLPADATLSGMTRYYEGDPLELQYKVDFEMDCGISFYFDHLYTLSPELQRLAEKLPEPKVNDTKVDPSNVPPRIKMKAGDIVATETGAHASQRYGIDFGVIDYRKRNSISQNLAWTAIHGNFKSSEWYGVCWFHLLPDTDADRAEELSVVQSDTRRTAKFVSDYCGNADHKTLDFFGGQPVDSY